mgnify:CR=1 FL=1
MDDVRTYEYNKIMAFRQSYKKWKHQFIDIEYFKIWFFFTGRKRCSVCYIHFNNCGECELRGGSKKSGYVCNISYDKIKTYWHNIIDGKSIDIDKVNKIRLVLSNKIKKIHNRLVDKYNKTYHASMSKLH